MRVARFEIAGVAALAMAGVLLAACASSSPSAVGDGRHSGFLGDYSALQETTDTAGDKVMRYVSPELAPGAYRAILLDPVRYYPAPAPSERVSAGTLEDIRTYLDRALREKFRQRLTLASQPGPGVLRLRPAITAVEPQTPGLKPYQYIPVAFIVTTLKGRGKVAALNLEVEAVDSVTGERMGASVRQGTGAKLSNDDAPLTLGDIQPLLDRWIETGASFIAALKQGQGH